MNRGFLAFTSFLVGGAVGAFITWKAIDKYYADLAEEEIQSVKERYYGEKEPTQEDSEDEKFIIKHETYPNKKNDNCKSQEQVHYADIRNIAKRQI